MKNLVNRGLLMAVFLVAGCEKREAVAVAPPSAIASAPTRGPLSSDAPPRSAPEGLASVPARDLRVTRGAFLSSDGEVARVRESKVRAVAPGTQGDIAALRFTVHGPSVESEPLASGAMRRQLGLKLLAADGCNLIYVMWRLAPKVELVVSVKENPGESVNADCGAHGYRTIAPDFVGPVPAPALGEPHVLAARIDRDVLTATIDGAIAWQGALHGASERLRGLVGFRTDNVAVDVALSVRRAGTTGFRTYDED